MPIFNFYRFENKQVDNEPSFLLQKRRQRLDLIREIPISQRMFWKFLYFQATPSAIYHEITW